MKQGSPSSREESLEVPAEALREALINALYIGQFEKHNLTLSIAIYDDRIDIENPGELPPQLTTETIKLPHNSYSYNSIMADVLLKTTFERRKSLLLSKQCTFTRQKAFS